MRRRSCFRPCIDLHHGQVKQIVGGTLSNDPAQLRTNFVASDTPDTFAKLYRKHDLTGGHVIMLGSGNEDAAKKALEAWPNGLQIGGGIDEDNANKWIERGASKIIVTSYLFPEGTFSLERLQQLSLLVGKDRLVVDVSCRRVADRWIVAMNKWQNLTDKEVSQDFLDLLSLYCSEFLIHAADVEGLCQGMDQELVKKLGEWVTIPTTYAGGAKDICDLELVDRLSHGKVDLTFGSALDIFGGDLVKFDDLVAFNKKQSTSLP